MRIPGPFKPKKSVIQIGAFPDMEQGIERRTPTGEVLDAYQRDNETDKRVYLGTLYFTGSRSITDLPWLNKAGDVVASIAHSASGILTDVFDAAKSLATDSIKSAPEYTAPQTQAELAQQRETEHARVRQEWNQNIQSLYKQNDQSVGQGVMDFINRVGDGKVQAQEIVNLYQTGVTKDKFNWNVFNQMGRNVAHFLVKLRFQQIADATQPKVIELPGGKEASQSGQFDLNRKEGNNIVGSSTNAGVG